MTAEDSSATTDRLMTAGKANMERMTEFSKSFLEKAVFYPQRIVETQLETSAEMFSFMSRRMQAQAEFLGRLAHCHAAEEALGVQREFAAGLTKDYSVEASHLAERTADIAQENFRTLTERAPDLGDEPSETAAEATAA
jgi:hypothetical protein